MEKDLGTKIKYGIIGVFLFGLVILFFWDNISPNTTNEQKTYQCNDGFDNDQDGFKDYPYDPDCKSPDDWFEKDLTNTVRNTIIILAILLGLFFWWKYIWKKEKKTENKLELVNADRGYDLAINVFLKKYATDIQCDIEIEKDGFHRLVPSNHDSIKIVKNMEDNFNKIEKFFITEIKVLEGKLSGLHILRYSLQRGENWLKNGGVVVETHNYEGNWKKQVRTYYPSSIQEQNERMALLKLEAFQDGDENQLKYLDNVFKNPASATGSSAFADLDDNEFREMMALQNLNSKSKAKAKNKGKSRQLQNSQDSIDEVNENVE